MFFRLLKLAGLDINAKIAELKAELATKIRQNSEEVTRRARTMGVVAGLLLCVAIFALLVLIVALIALYKWGEMHYGVFVGLALDAGVLTVLAIILVAVALWIAQQDGKTIARRARVAKAPIGDPTPLTQNPPRPPNEAKQSAKAFASYQSAPVKAEDIIEPIFALFGRHVRWPQTGRPVIDDLLQQVGSRAQGTADEAVTRAAELVRNGDRTTMLSVLGAAALCGWLIARATAQPNPTSRISL